MSTLRDPRWLLALVLALVAVPAPSRGGDDDRATTVLGSSVRADAPLVVELALEARVVGRFVPLRSVVTVPRDIDEVWAIVGETLVHVGEGDVVRRADIERRIARAGLATDRFRVDGPAFCCCAVEPPGAEVARHDVPTITIPLDGDDR